MTRTRVGMVGVLCFLSIGACSYFADTTAPYQPPEELPEGPERARLIYAQDCAWCHGDRGEGTLRGPDLITAANGEALTHFMVASGRMPIDHPRQFVGRGPALYDDEDAVAVAEYVASFGGAGPMIPHVDPDSGDLAQGQHLYNENCASCHSATGVGGALAADDPLTAQVGSRAPRVAGTPTEVAEAILTGPATMPVFDEDAFTDQEMDSLVRYVMYLQDPNQRGGWSIGFLGPVAEGAVAWIVGLGALLLLIRWIGTSMREEE